MPLRSTSRNLTVGGLGNFDTTEGSNPFGMSFVLVISVFGVAKRVAALCRGSFCYFALERGILTYRPGLYDTTRYDMVTRLGPGRGPTFGLFVYSIRSFLHPSFLSRVDAARNRGWQSTAYRRCSVRPSKTSCGYYRILRCDRTVAVPSSACYAITQHQDNVNISSGKHRCSPKKSSIIFPNDTRKPLAELSPGGTLHN